MALTPQLQVELDALEARLCPAVGPLTDADHAVARARAGWDALFFEIYDTVEALKRLSTPEAMPDKDVLRREARRLDALFAHEDSTEPWLGLMQPPFWANLQAGLAEAHAGDCTGVAGTCWRCFCEDAYRLPSSVTWSGKAEGSRLMHRYFELKRLAAEGLPTEDAAGAAGRPA